MLKLKFSISILSSYALVISVASITELPNLGPLGINNSNFYETIDTNSTASAQQKAQEGNYWDSFINLNFKHNRFYVYYIFYESRKQCSETNNTYTCSK